MTSDISQDLVQRSMQARYANWIRVLQIFCSFILSVIGMGGIAVCVLAKIGIYNELKLLDHYENINVSVFLAYSVVLVAISWLGIFAGLRNCYRSMFTSATLLGSLIIASIAYVATTGVLTNYTKTGKLHQQMTNNMKDNLDIVNTLRSTLLCCDLKDITWNMNPFPKSCCPGIVNNKDCVFGSRFLHTRGCFEEFLRMGRSYSWTLFTVVAAYGLLGIFGIILSHLRCQIMKDMKKKRAGGDLKIPRAHVHGQNGESHEEKKDQEKNEEEKNKKEENKKENKEEIKNENKEEIKNAAGSSESSEEQTSEKKNSVEIITESNTCRNICKEFTCGRNMLTIHFY